MAQLYNDENIPARGCSLFSQSSQSGIFLSVSCSSLYIQAGKKGTLSITSSHSGIELSCAPLTVVLTLAAQYPTEPIDHMAILVLSGLLPSLQPCRTSFLSLIGPSVEMIAAFSQISLPSSLVIIDMVSFVSACCALPTMETHTISRLIFLPRMLRKNHLFLVFSIKHTLRIIDTNIYATNSTCFDQFCSGSNSVNVASLAHLPANKAVYESRYSLPRPPCPRVHAHA